MQSFFGSLPGYTLQLLMEIHLMEMLGLVARPCEVKVVLAPFDNENQCDSEATEFNHWASDDKDEMRSSAE